MNPRKISASSAWERERAKRIGNSSWKISLQLHSKIDASGVHSLEILSQTPKMDLKKNQRRGTVTGLD